MTALRTSDLLVERDGNVVVVTLNRPHRRNALSVTLIEQLGDVFTELADSTSDERVGSDVRGPADPVGAVLVRGADGYFCSGLDIKDIRVLDAPTRAWARVHLAVARIEVPVIAALAGGAVNGGAALALGCDLLISGENAYLQIMEAAMGVSAPINAAWLAERHSAGVGLQLLLSGRRFTGPELLRLGIAFDVVPDADVETRARALCQQLAEYPNRGAMLAKRSIVRASAPSATFAARVNATLGTEPAPPVSTDGGTPR